MEDAHSNKREDTQRATPPSRARITRARGQRLRKSQRRKLKDRFIDQYGDAASIQDLCAQLGVTRYTFYAWLRSDSEFKRRYDAKVASYALDPMADYSATSDLDTLLRGMSERELMKSLLRMERTKLRRGEIHDAWWK